MSLVRSHVVVLALAVILSGVLPGAGGGAAVASVSSVAAPAAAVDVSRGAPSGPRYGLNLTTSAIYLNAGSSVVVRGSSRSRTNGGKRIVVEAWTGRWRVLASARLSRAGQLPARSIAPPSNATKLRLRLYGQRATVAHRSREVHVRPLKPVRVTFEHTPQAGELPVLVSGADATFTVRHGGSASLLATLYWRSRWNTPWYVLEREVPTRGGRLRLQVPIESESNLKVVLRHPVARNLELGSSPAFRPATVDYASHSILGESEAVGLPASAVREAPGRAAVKEVSADGRYVVHRERSEGSGGAGPAETLHRWDRTERRSLPITGDLPPGAAVDLGDISDDGRFVAYRVDHADRADHYLWDAATGTAERMSGADAFSASGTARAGRGISVSPRGVLVAYTARVERIGADGERREVEAVFTWRRSTGATQAVSTTPDGEIAEAGARSPRVSGNARWVSFVSAAPDLTATPLGGGSRIYLHDADYGGLVVASPAGVKDAHAINHNGSQIAFLDDRIGISRQVERSITYLQPRAARFDDVRLLGGRIVFTGTQVRTARPSAYQTPLDGLFVINLDDTYDYVLQRGRQGESLRKGALPRIVGLAGAGRVLFADEVDALAEWRERR